MNTSSAPLPLTPEAAPAVRFRWRILVLVALFFCLLLPRLSSGTLYQHDELFTANRAREILVRGDPWTVTLNFAPDFRKPPLQYWFCALALRWLPAHPELAVRLPSLLYGAACLLAVAWLARRCYGDEGPGTGLAAALALAGCGFFVHSSRIGLLDAGAALHVTLAVAGCQLVRRDPRWWWFVGLQCVLGAWQKAPFAFAAWVVILSVRWFGGDGPGVPRPSLRPHLLAAFSAALLVASSWWLLQAFRHGFGALQDAGSWQTHALAVAHDPGDTGFRPWIYWGWLARDWALPGLCAPVMIVGALRRRWRRSSDATPVTPTAEIAWVCAMFAVGLVLVPYRAERYLVVFTPLLALLMVRWLRDAASRLPPRLAAPRWLLALALASTLPVALFHYLGAKPIKTDLLSAAREIARTLRPEETLVLTAHTDPGFEVQGFVEFYAGLRRPLQEITLSGLRPLVSPLRGVCSRRQWPELVRAEPSARQVFARGNWVVWTR